MYYSSSLRNSDVPTLTLLLLLLLDPDPGDRSSHINETCAEAPRFCISVFVSNALLLAFFLLYLRGHQMEAKNRI